MTRSLLLVLALGAALVGAPSRVSAASNLLLVPQVSPTSGTTATTFTFSVRYQGRFPASAVTAAAGTTTVVLARVAGTSTDGTWRGSSQLPAGTWPVAFTAVVAQGNEASAAGPTVTVLPASQSTATPSSLSSPPSAGGAGPAAAATDAGGASTGSPAADVAPVEPSAPADSSPVAAPVPTPAAAPLEGAPQAPAPPNRTSSPPSGAPPAGAPASAAGETPPDAGRLGDGAAGGSPPASPAAFSGVGHSEDLGRTALILALAGLALLAVFGSGLLLVAGRRRRSATPEGATLDATSADAVVDRRALRRARMRLEEDPIVAAMGLPDAESAAERRARRTAKQGRGR